MVKNRNGFSEEKGFINLFLDNDVSINHSLNKSGNIYSDTNTDDLEDNESAFSPSVPGVEYDYDEFVDLEEDERLKIEQQEQQLAQKKMLMDKWRKSYYYNKMHLSIAYGQIKREKMRNFVLNCQIEEKNNEIENLNAKLKNLQESINEVRNLKKELEMKLTEMKKISEGMAEKSSKEAVLGFIRRYVNHSKRKTSDKRAFAKQATLEIANANGLDLPEDLKATIESLDDENPEPKVINVAGNLNDIHDNTTVNQK